MDALAGEPSRAGGKQHWEEVGHCGIVISKDGYSSQTSGSVQEVVKVSCIRAVNIMTLVSVFGVTPIVFLGISATRQASGLRQALSGQKATSSTVSNVGEHQERTVKSGP